MKNTLLLKHFSMYLVLFVAILLAVPNATMAQRKTKAEEVSESQPPDSYGPGRQGKAKSNSKAPKRQRGSRVRSKTDTRFIMNAPRSPLRPSDRDRFYGISALEIGLNIGTSHVFTDVGGKPGTGNWDAVGFVKDNVSYSTGLFVRYKINEWFGLAGGVDHARLTASNKNGYIYKYDMSEIIPRSETIYSFTNNIYELSWKMELHTPPFKNSGLGLYGFAGIAGLYNNPEMFDASGQLVLIEDNAYNSSSSPYFLALPVGGGVTLMVANFVRVGWEIGFRYTANQGIDGAYVTNSRYDSFLYNTVRVGYVLPLRR